MYLWFHIRLFLYTFRKRIEFWLCARTRMMSTSMAFVHPPVSLQCAECRQKTTDMRQYSIGGDRWVQEGVCAEHGKSFMIVDGRAVLDDLSAFDRALSNVRSKNISLTGDELALHLDRAGKRRSVQHQSSRSWAAWAAALFMLLLLIFTVVTRGEVTINI